MCVVVLTTCVQAVSHEKSEAEQGNTLQPLEDKCCEKALRALKEAEQKIQTLNDTVQQLTANQTQMNAKIEANSNAITTNKNSIANNTKRFSTLTSYPCNCTTQKEARCLDPKKVATGFTGLCFLPRQYCGIDGVLTVGGQGIMCCNTCLGTDKEAEAYAQAHPMPLHGD